MVLAELAEPTFDDLQIGDPIEEDNASLFFRDAFEYQERDVKSWVVRALIAMMLARLEVLSFETDYEASRSRHVINRIMHGSSASEWLTSTRAVRPEEALDDTSLIDEPLEPIPLRVRPIRLKLRYGGRGEPILQSDAELNLYDD